MTTAVRALLIVFLAAVVCGVASLLPLPRFIRDACEFVFWMGIAILAGVILMFG